MSALYDWYDKISYNLKHFDEWLIWALHDERIMPVTGFVERWLSSSKGQGMKVSKKIPQKRIIRPAAKIKPQESKPNYNLQRDTRKPVDFTSDKNLTKKQIKDIQIKNARTRFVKSLENGTYVKLYNALLDKIDILREALAIAGNWLVNLPNSVQIMMVTALVLIFGLMGMSVFGTIPTTLKVKDSISSMVSFKAEVPRIWATEADTSWPIRNFVYPTNSFVKSVYKKGTIVFIYQSPQIYAEILDSSTIAHNEGQYSKALNFEMRKFMTAERFIDNYVRKENLNANEIKIYSKDIMDAKIIDTLKLKQKEQSGKNPYIMPAIVTYSYVQNGARYKQTIMTVISSIDKETNAPNEQRQMEAVSYRLWRVHFILSYKARLTPYQKYLSVFNKFAQSIEYNKNWLKGVSGTIAELENSRRAPEKESMPATLLVTRIPGQPRVAVSSSGSLQSEDIVRKTMARFKNASKRPVYEVFGIEEPYRSILNDFALNSIIYQYDDYGTTIRMPLKYKFVYRNKNTGDVIGTDDSSYKPSPEYVKLRKKGN